MTTVQAADFLLTHDNYLILTHIRPDGDTIGCAAGLCQALRQRGKTAYILENPDAASLFDPYLDGLTIGADWTPDTVVAVDMAARSMFPDNACVYLDKVDLTIDHHPSQEFFAAQTCLDPGAAACGEILYDIVKQFGPVTSAIATPLYVAISTDCGCFMYNNTTPDTHRVAATLMECGIDTPLLNKRHFRTKSIQRMKLESAMIAGMELYDNNTIAVVCVTSQMLAETGATRNDKENLAALAGMLEGVKTSVTIQELAPNTHKISMRTDPSDLNANTVCGLLGGGGHAAASGATLQADLTETKAAVLAAIKQVKYGS